MKYRINITAKLTAFNDLQKIFFIDIFRNFTINQIFEFVGFGQIIDRDNILDAALI